MNLDFKKGIAKVIKIITISGLTFSLVACGNEEKKVEVSQPTTPAPTANVVTPTPEQKKEIKKGEFGPIIYFADNIEKNAINDFLHTLYWSFLFEGYDETFANYDPENPNNPINQCLENRLMYYYEDGEYLKELVIESWHGDFITIFETFDNNGEFLSVKGKQGFDAIKKKLAEKGIIIDKSKQKQ